MQTTRISTWAAILAILAVTSTGSAETQQVTTRANDQSTTTIELFLSGDVMLGRAVDQILPYRNDPVLYEDYIRDARDYVRLAVETNGPIPAPVSCAYIWGDALQLLDTIDPDARIINLETSVTQSGTPWKNKYIHYRMHPGNVPCLSAAKIDIALLANNHVLDWGYSGLDETLRSLDRAGIRTAGSGKTRQDADRPAVIDLGTRGKVIVTSWAHASSGVPRRWAATHNRPGVSRLDYLDDTAVERIRASIQSIKQTGDVAVASIHWGANWGYDIPAWQTEFAHRLIDHADVDVVHGHSSHHVKAIEVYRGKLIIYGSGDLLNDYEGIRGHEEFRADLSLMYFAAIDASTGRLTRLQMAPTQIRNLRINRAADQDASWLMDLLNREGARFGTSVIRGRDNRLLLDW